MILFLCVNCLFGCFFFFFVRGERLCAYRSGSIGSWSETGDLTESRRSRYYYSSSGGVCVCVFVSRLTRSADAVVRIRGVEGEIQHKHTTYSPQKNERTNERDIQKEKNSGVGGRFSVSASIRSCWRSACCMKRARITSLLYSLFLSAFLPRDFICSSSQRRTLLPEDRSFDNK